MENDRSQEVELKSFEMFDEHEEPLQNDLVLKVIMGKLSIVDLIKVRRVSKPFREATTFEILRRKCFQINLTCCSTSATPCYFHTTAKISHNHTPANNLWSLDELNKIVEKSTRFPCNQFKFDGGNLGSAQVLHLFFLMGPQIRTLYFHPDHGDFQDVKTSFEIFHQILTNHTPNIETLGLSAEFFDDWKNSENLKLPNLKIFDLCHGSVDLKMVQKILNGAPHLESILNLSISSPNLPGAPGGHLNLADLIEAGKLTLVKSLKIVNCLFSTIFQNLVFPRLQKLCVTLPAATSNGPGDARQHFYAILIASQNSLKSLKVTNEGDQFLPILKIPALAQLKRLHFAQFLPPAILGPFLRGTAVAALNNYSPTVIRLNKNCPKLSILALEENCLPFYFQPMQSLPLVTVRVIELTGILGSKYLFENVFAPFPNLDTLHVRCRIIDKVELLLRPIFSVKWSRGIKIVIFVDKMGPSFSLDSVLIGSTLEQAKILYFCLTNDHNDVPNFDWQRQFSWIGSIEGLTSLKILFGDLTPWAAATAQSDGDWTSVPISKVSALYAFQFLPKVDFTIGYNQLDHRYNQEMAQLLEPLAPFVEIVHWKAHEEFE